MGLPVRHLRRRDGDPLRGRRRWPRTTRRDRPRHHRRHAVRRASASSSRATCSSRTRKRLDADAANALPLYAEGAGLLAAGASRAVPAARRPRDRRAARAAAGRPPPRRREVRRPAHPAMSAGGAKPKKLVLTVIDAMKPAMLERAVGDRARAGAQAADRARRDGRRLRRGVPLGDAGVRGEHRHRGRPRRARHPVDELVPPRRGALRRVRHELQGLADVRLQALAHRHDLQHEPRAPVEGRQDGVRVARRRRHPHRRHDVPDVPRAPPPRGDERHRAHAPRLDGLPPRRLRPARVLLRGHLRLAQDGLPRPARPAGPARPARRLRRRAPGRERPVRLPAAVAARQRHALAPQRPVRPGVLDRRGRQADRAPDARRAAARRRSSRTTR